MTDSGKTNVYVLQLEHDCYYVGRSNRPAIRIEDHFSNNFRGAWWTSRHKPLRVFNVYRNVSPFEEDRITIEMMSIYGVENVRGGTFCSATLSPEEKSYILKSIRGAKNQCYRCGDSGHFINQCPKPDASKGWWAQYTEPVISGVYGFFGSMFTTESSPPTYISESARQKASLDKNFKYSSSSKRCSRCGRTSHSESDCYAQFDAFGNRL